MRFRPVCGFQEQGRDSLPVTEPCLARSSEYWELSSARIRRCTNRPARLDPVTPADNPKSGNAFSTRTCPRRCNLDLDANRILTWAAIASRSASRHARPGPLRGARGTCRRRGSHLRAGASVRRNDDNGQGDKFDERFHGSSPISPWLPARHETKLSPSRPATMPD